MKKIIKAARPRTLPLSLSSVIVGNSIALYLMVFDIVVFILSILCVVFLQILSNFSNDLGDYQKGTDNEDRIGPQRAVQAGEINLRDMKKYIFITIILCLASGVSLLYVSKLLMIEKIILFIMGILAILAAYYYTMTKKAYGYRALGDLSVFIFFGLLGVLGSLFLQIHHINNSAILPAAAMGLLSVSVLHLNNMRDMDNDLKNNKKTIANILGIENSKLYFTIIVSLAVILWASHIYTRNIYFHSDLIYWVGLSLIVFILMKFWKIKTNKGYDSLLKPMTLSIFLTSILFFISQIII